MRAKTIAAKDSKKKERPKPKPMEEGPVLYVSSPIAPDTAKIYFAVVKELLEEKGCKAIVMGEPKIDFEKHDGNLFMPYVDLLAEEIREIGRGVVPVLNGSPGDIMVCALREHPEISEYVSRMIFMNCSLHTMLRDEEIMDSHNYFIDSLKQLEKTFGGRLGVGLMTSKILETKTGFDIGNAVAELSAYGYPEPEVRIKELKNDICNANLGAGPKVVRKALEGWTEMMEKIDYETVYGQHGEIMYHFCTGMDAEKLRTENTGRVFQAEGAEHHIVTLDKPVTSTRIILDVLNGKYD